MLGLLLPNSLRYSQYAFKYSEILEEFGVEHEFVFWNRDGYSLNCGRFISFNKQMEDFLPIWKKMPAYLEYANFINRTIRDRAYDGLIVFTSQLAVMLMPTLLNSYKGKYIFDYRDVSREGFLPYKSAVRKIASGSWFTAVSSPAFRNVIGLDCSPYVISHNERRISCELHQKSPSDEGLIRVAYWGIIRQPSFNQLICQRFGSDRRFSLVYHGSGCIKELEDFCSDNDYRNIQFTGVYDEHSINTFVKTTDLLLNAYDNDVVQKPAYTVKYYDSLRYGIPMLVTEGCAMAESVQAKKLGMAVNWDDPCCMDSIYQFYMNLNRNMYLRERNIEVERIKADDEIFKTELKKFISPIEK